MSAETLARWQFGITTVYHFFFVPITIGLSILVAVLQTKWNRSGDEKFLRLTKFFGKLFLINFAMGVVTGIVQEFQFGMNWSEYSRFVGDIFGAPLALEALLAFFLESVFLGLWIFGWDRLPKGVHLATIWLGSIGTVISSIFILLANSWMQNPVGATYDPTLGRAHMDDFLAVLTNPVGIITILHVWSASFMTAGGIILAVCGWHLAKFRGLQADGSPSESKDVPAHRWAAKFGAWVLIVASVFVMGTGHVQGQIMTDIQPAKMAATENLHKTTACAPFEIIPGVGVPCVLSFMATNDPNATIEGLDDLQAKYQATVGQGKPFDPNNTLQASAAQRMPQMLQQMQKMYGQDPANMIWTPDIWPAFWSFRLMMGLGGLGLLVGIISLWMMKGTKLPKPSKLWTCMMIATPLLPLFASSFGWIMAEMGRQPWIVNGVLPTMSAVSPGVTGIEVVLTMLLYTVIYGVLAVVEVGLFLKTIKSGLPVVKEPEVLTDDDAPLTFAY